MTKLFAVAVAAMMAFSMTSSASAFGWSTPSVNIDNGWTHVVTVAKADVDTGSVSQLGGSFLMAKTGDVYGVSAVGLSQVNMTKFGGCACNGMTDVTVKNMGTDVVTVAKADVDTGKVTQFSWSGMKSAKTGSVTYVETGATSVVNYTDFSVSTPE